MYWIFCFISYHWIVQKISNLYDNEARWGGYTPKGIYQQWVLIIIFQKVAGGQMQRHFNALCYLLLIMSVITMWTQEILSFVWIGGDKNRQNVLENKRRGDHGRNNNTEVHYICLSGCFLRFWQYFAKLQVQCGVQCVIWRLRVPSG